MRGARVRLRPREFDLLRAFMERPRRLLTREFLIAELWAGSRSATRARSTFTSCACGG